MSAKLPLSTLDVNEAHRDLNAYDIDVSYRSAFKRVMWAIEYQSNYFNYDYKKTNKLTLRYMSQFDLPTLVKTVHNLGSTSVLRLQELCVMKGLSVKFPMPIKKRVRKHCTTCTCDQK